MPKVQETKTLNIDNTPYAVEKMSPQLQQLVALMDEWRQEEVDASTKLTMIRSALQNLQNSIYTTVNEERNQAMAKAKAMGLIKEDAPAANDVQAAPAPAAAPATDTPAQ